MSHTLLIDDLSKLLEESLKKLMNVLNCIDIMNILILYMTEKNDSQKGLHPLRTWMKCIKLPSWFIYRIWCN